MRAPTFILTLLIIIELLLIQVLGQSRCDTLRTNWANAGTKRELFCRYYDTTNLTALSVLTGSDRIFRNDITMPTLLFPNYTFLEVYALANFSTTTPNLGMRLMSGTTNLWGSFFTSGTTVPAVMFFKSTNYPAIYRLEIFTSATTFGGLRNFIWAGVFYQINRCISYKTGSDLCFGCDLGFILNTTSYKSCYSNISRCEAYVPGTASNLNCSRC